jgi:hypothetical protein
MLATLALMSSLALAPGQIGELKLANPRATYGVLGAVRKDAKILPGDVFFLTFDIENLKMDEEGKITYSMGMELVNPKGESEYKRDPLERPPLYNVLGGNRIPAFAHAETSAGTMPGEYTLKVTVVDEATAVKDKKGKVVKPGKAVTLAQKFTVADKGFGLVKLTTSYDKDGILSAPFGGMAGQSLFCNFWIVGFKRVEGQPNITFEMKITDENDKPTLPKAMMGQINKGVSEDWELIPMNFILPLNRPGKFTVHLKATDLVTKKNTELKFPITVVELK